MRDGLARWYGSGMNGPEETLRGLRDMTLKDVRALLLAWSGAGLVTLGVGLAFTPGPGAALAQDASPPAATPDQSAPVAPPPAGRENAPAARSRVAQAGNDPRASGRSPRGASLHGHGNVLRALPSGRQAGEKPAGRRSRQYHGDRRDRPRCGAGDSRALRMLRASSTSSFHVIRRSTSTTAVGKAGSRRRRISKR